MHMWMGVMTVSVTLIQTFNTFSDDVSESVLHRILNLDRIPNTEYIQFLKMHRIPNTEYIRFFKNDRIQIPNSAIRA